VSWPFLNVAGQLGLFGLASHFCLVNLAHLAIWPDWPLLPGQLSLFSLLGLSSQFCRNDDDICTPCYLSWPFLNVAGQLGLFGLASHFWLE